MHLGFFAEIYLENTKLAENGPNWANMGENPAIRMREMRGIRKMHSKGLKTAQETSLSIFGVTLAEKNGPKCSEP